jgi:hypothetical protein
MSRWYLCCIATLEDVTAALGAMVHVQLKYICNACPVAATEAASMTLQLMHAASSTCCVHNTACGNGFLCWWRTEGKRAAAHSLHAGVMCWALHSRAVQYPHIKYFETYRCTHNTAVRGQCASGSLMTPFALVNGLP